MCQPQKFGRGCPGVDIDGGGGTTGHQRQVLASQDIAGDVAGATHSKAGRASAGANGEGVRDGGGAQDGAPGVAQ